MIKGLLADFQAIKRGLPVNWKSIKKKLICCGANDDLITKALAVEAYSDNEYKVTIICTKAFNTLEDYAKPTDKSSRSAASKSGNTHSTRVNGAMLTAWGIESEVPYNRVFLPEKKDPRPLKKHALLIENLECFLNKDDTYQFVQRHCGVTVKAEDVEFIWAAGNSISNKLIIPYLQGFKSSVMCLLDVDLGGLQIYANLLSGGLPAESTHYVVPNNLKDRLRKSRRHIGDKELQSLSKVYGLSPLTDGVISAIRYYKSTLEQEGYRAVNCSL